MGKIRIQGENGQAVEVDGLAIRWTLDVPDTLAAGMTIHFVEHVTEVLELAIVLLIVADIIIAMIVG